MGVKPAAIAAWIFFSTTASVSPKYCLRSLCPMMTQEAPAALSISGDNSPVKAPSRSQNVFWPPIAISEPAVAVTAAGMASVGGQTTISHLSSAGVACALNCSKKSVASWAVLYIFQLAAITRLLIGLEELLSFLNVAEEAGAGRDLSRPENFGYSLPDIRE